MRRDSQQGKSPLTTVWEQAGYDELSPQLAFAFGVRAARHTSNRDYTRAIRDYSKLVELEPLFLNLGSVSLAKLEAEGGFFGSVLQLVQQRRARASEFQQLVRHVVSHLEAIPPRERLRWLELLSYIHALVYHERDPAERANIQETIESSVQTDQHRKEIFEMGKTIAEELEQRGIQRGEIRARQTTLIRLLRKRFAEVPDETVHTIEATQEIAQLDDWLDRVVTARTLRDVGVNDSM